LPKTNPKKNVYKKNQKNTNVNHGKNLKISKSMKNYFFFEENNCTKKCCWNKRKLDGVGPVDNKPSTHKLHYFVRKKRKKKKHDM
jgi:hypothetical protein